MGRVAPGAKVFRASVPPQSGRSYDSRHDVGQRAGQDYLTEVREAGLFIGSRNLIRQFVLRQGIHSAQQWRDSGRIFRIQIARLDGG